MVEGFDPAEEGFEVGDFVRVDGRYNDGIRAWACGGYGIYLGMVLPKVITSSIVILMPSGIRWYPSALVKLTLVSPVGDRSGKPRRPVQILHDAALTFLKGARACLAADAFNRGIGAPQPAAADGCPEPDSPTGDA